MEHTPYHMQHAVYHTAYKYTTRLPESGCVQVTVADYHQLLLLLCPDFPEWVVSKAAEAIPTLTELAPADGAPRKVCP